MPSFLLHVSRINLPEWQEKEKIHMLHPSCLHVLRAMEYWLSSPDFLVGNGVCVCMRVHACVHVCMYVCISTIW